MNFRLPHDSIMHITEDGFTAVELGSFNRKVKTKYIPHENINKLMVRKWENMEEPNYKDVFKKRINF